MARPKPTKISIFKGHNVAEIKNITLCRDVDNTWELGKNAQLSA